MAAAVATECGKQNAGTLAHMSSADAAADIDLIRTALGVGKLNFVLRGYGTYLGQLYASAHPERVGRIVLGGPDSPRGVAYETFASRPIGLDRVLGRFFDWVARNDTYFGIAATAAAVAAAYDAQRAALLTAPVGTLGPSEWTLTFRNLATFDEQTWPTLAVAWSQLEAGVPTFMQSLVGFAATPDEIFDATVAAQECTDANFPRSYDRMREDAFTAAEDAPLTAWSELWKNNARCVSWPVRGTRAVVDGAKTPPMLVVSGADAGSGSLAEALAVRAEFPRSSLVVVESSVDSFGEVLFDNACVDALVHAYLLDGALPIRKPGARTDADCGRIDEPGPQQIAEAVAQLALLAALSATDGPAGAIPVRAPARELGRPVTHRGGTAP